MEQTITLHRPQRRDFVKKSVGATVGIAAYGLLCQSEAWALEVQAMSPGEAKTLFQVCRDIYPHDRIPDKNYALIVKGLDAKASKDSKFKALLADGLADLDKRAKAAFKRHYANVGWEIERNKLLREVESSRFFQAVRGDMVVSLYNQPDVWTILGYEGESASKGGYIKRGFNDLTWL
jgi:hypothetical protein